MEDQWFYGFCNWLVGVTLFKWVSVCYILELTFGKCGRPLLGGIGQLGSKVSSRGAILRLQIVSLFPTRL